MTRASRRRVLDASRGCVDPENLLLLKDVAPAQGLSTTALRRLLARHGRRLYHVGRHVAAHLQDLEWAAAYREHRASTATRRPPGWLGSKQVSARLGVDIGTLSDLSSKGDLIAVRVARLYYYCPESVEAVRLRRETPPPGWLSLTDLAREHGWKYSSLHFVVKRMGLPARTYYAREGVGRRTRRCIRESDLARVTAHMSAPASYPGRLRTADLAEVCGVSCAAVRFWTRKGLTGLKDRMGSLWFDPAETLAWIVTRPDPRMRPSEARLRAYLAEQQQRAA